ncbi:hypothetical protein KFE98_03475 [bacterium SCSIO 12741]|nr:hypothetical protein KFE98_03475 [bacterium SCSIO 12741]
METVKSLNATNPKKIGLFSTQEIKSAYQAVFRNSTEEPGFYYWDLGDQIDSRTFRQYMVELKNGLAQLCESQLQKRLNYQSMGRFNHQHTSRYHRDNGDTFSFLMLGYEPTPVDSRAFITDYTKYLEKENLSLIDFFGGDQEANLVLNQEMLDPYTTEMNPFHKDHYRLLLLNNSKSYDAPSHGVFHSAEIPHKMEEKDRVLNYLMLHLCDWETKEHYDEQAVHDFIYNDKVDR